MNPSSSHRPHSNNSKILGSMFVLSGVMVLLLELSVVPGPLALLWPLTILTINSAFFLLTQKRLSWSARVIGFVLLSLIGVRFAGEMMCVVIFGSLALGFLIAYEGSARRWWCLLVSGLFGGVALFTMMEELFPHWNNVPIVPLMAAATFSLLYLLPRNQGGKQWAMYPAMMLTLLTVLVNDPSGRTNPLIPITLITSGVVLLWFWQRDHSDH